MNSFLDEKENVQPNSEDCQDVQVTCSNSTFLNSYKNKFSNKKLMCNNFH